MKTFGTVLDEHKGIGPGFDTLRVLLSFCVIFYHCFPIGTGTTASVKESVFWPFAYAILPMFFCLSGFLVTGSALRLKIGRFAFSRVIRIVPALAVDTLVTVLLIGPLFTTVPLAEYSRDPMTWTYLGNIVGEVHFNLPGVFVANPYSAVVNGSLWTIPPELGCYVLMGLLMVCGLLRRPSFVLAAALLFFLLLIIAHWLPTTADFKGRGWLLSPGAKLVPSFLTGAYFYLVRHKLVFDGRMFGAGITFLVVCGVVGSAVWWENVLWIVVSIPILAYLILFAGLNKLPLPDIFRRGDYSYGIYLYGFSIQQSIVALIGPTSPFVLFGLTILPVMILAMGSWHLVEKPALRLRKAFSLTNRSDGMSK